MLLAVRPGRAAFYVVACPPSTIVAGAMLDGDIHHIALGMFPAVHRGLVSLDIEPRPFRAGVKSATPTADVDHTLLCMLLAERRRSSVDIKARSFGA